MVVLQLEDYAWDLQLISVKRNQHVMKYSTGPQILGGSCKHGNEHLVYMGGGIFLDEPSDC
jgi:hypothetical protein